MKRTLSLKRESLAELSDEQLTGLNGAAYEVSLPNLICQIKEPSGAYLCTWQPTRCLCP